MVSHFIMALEATGDLKSNLPHLTDYYGSLSHRNDLLARLGLDPAGWFPKNRQQRLHFLQRIDQAIAHYADDQSDRLYVADMELLFQLQRQLLDHERQG